MIESFPATSWFAIALARLPLIRMAQKGAVALGVKIASAALSLALQIALARLLGAESYGDYAYAFGWLQIMLIFAQGGFSTAALRYVGEYRARGESALLNGFLLRSTQIALLESIIFGLLTIGIAAALRGRIGDPLLTNLVIVGVSLPVLSQFVLHSAIVRGLGEAIASIVVGLAQPLLFLATLLACVLVIPRGLTSSRALSLNLGTATVALAIVVLAQRRFQTQAGLNSIRDGRAYRTLEWIGTALQMMLASGLVYFHARIGVVATGLVLDPQSAGTYAMVERVADVACLGLTSVNLLVGPSFAAMHAQGRQIELQRYARLAAIGSTLIMIATALPIAVFGRQILSLFGEGFVAGYPTLLILLTASVVTAMCGSAVLLLSMTGHHRVTTLTAAGSFAVNLALTYFLAPWYGIAGTAFATAASVILWSVSLVLIARWRLKIWTNVGWPVSQSVL